MKELILSQNKIAIVDDEDFDRLNKFKWSALKRNKGFHAYRNKNRKMYYMHHEVLNISSQTMIDHINRDGLDNRKCNLRLTNKRLNYSNSWNEGNISGYRGVTIRNDGRKKKYRATINCDGKQIFLGGFYNAEDAGKAYDIAALEYYGESTHLNFPKDKV